MGNIIEQKAADQPLSIEQGDDYFPVFTLPFDITSWVWECSLYKNNGNEIPVTVVTNIISSVSSSIQPLFSSTVTSVLEKTSIGKEHSWKVKYIDDNGIKRTFIKGAFSVL